jgi:hypothetical protein
LDSNIQSQSGPQLQQRLIASALELQQLLKGALIPPCRFNQNRTPFTRSNFEISGFWS